jgi:response regulator of citrate/malate metabolism
MVARAHERLVNQVDGFTVVGTAHTGAQALSLIRELAPDLVLLDIYLPDQSGVDVIRQARSSLPEVDFIVVSAAREGETVGAALQGGIVSYLFKPFRVEELSARLAAYLDRRRTLEGGGALDQAQLDRALGGGRAFASTLPKGISAETAALVERSLKGAKADVSAAECAEALGLSRIAVRKYLEYFVETGTAEVQLRYGQAGRPQRRYRWAGSTPD